MRTTDCRLEYETFAFTRGSEKRIYVFDHVFKVNKNTRQIKKRIALDLQSPRLCYTYPPMEDNEKEGLIYILGIVGLIASIIILVSLTHVVLHP